MQTQDLLLVLLALISTVLLRFRSLGLLSPDTAWTPTAERRCEREVNVLLRVEAHDERWDVDDLLADAAIEMSAI